MTEGIDVVYCPTAKMLADFFTKPLQGSLFRKFRDVILGYKHIDTLLEEEDTLLEDDEEDSTKERIGSRTDDSNDSMKSDCDSMESDCGEPNPSSSINRGATQSQSWADIVRG